MKTIPRISTQAPFVQSKQVALWLMILIFLLSSILRLPWLSVQSIAFDESFSLVVGLAEWAVLFEAILSDGVHPPLFYIIHKGALALWGTTEFGQRFSATLFGIISVALIYKAGHLIFENRWVGMFGALLLALNPVQLWLAQEARMYTLLTALTLMSFILFWQAIRSNKRVYWFGLTLIHAIIFGLHYFGFLIPTIQFVFILVNFGHTYTRLRPWTLTQIGAFIPLLPWLILTALRDAQTFGIGFLERPNLLDFGLTLWNLLLGSVQMIWPIFVIAVLLIGVTLWFASRPIPPHQVRVKQARWLILIWGVFPITITWIVSQRRAFYADRYLSFAIPAFLLLFGFALSRIKTPRWQWSVTIAFVLISGYGALTMRNDPAFWKDDWRQVAGYISQQQRAEDAVLLYSTHIKFVFDYYYEGTSTPTPISLNLQNFAIDPLVDGHQRAWLVYPYTRRPTHYPMQPLLPDGYWQDDPDRNPELVAWLEQHQANIVDYQHFRGVEVWLVNLNDKVAE